jgi:MFS family permease
MDTSSGEPARPSTSSGSLILPLALAQFIASYAATNMNVAISSIASDIHTTVIGVQTAITLFTLVMASLMIPGSKLTDIWGRKRCFVIGLGIYAAGALIALAAPALGILIAGYSFFEGVGSALMIPPIYILVTVAFPDIKSRAKYFGIVSGAGGLGAAAGPLIGGLITSGISWRASFGLQVLVVLWIIFMARKIIDPVRSGPRPRFDFLGAVWSALGLCFIVLGLLISRTYGFLGSRKDFSIGGAVIIPTGWISPVWISIAIGALFLLWFFLHIRSFQRKGRDVLIRMRMFQNRVANIGMGTQLIQWLVLQGSFFSVSVFLQQVRHFSAIETGLMMIPAIAGLLATAAAADRFARRHTQRGLIIFGFVLAAAGMGLLLGLVRKNSGDLSFVPGLLLFGAGVGIMLTSSVNIVQSSFSEADQGDISGLSRSVSNLGSSLGTALVGSVLVAAAAGYPFAAAAGLLLGFALIGLGLSVLLPRQRTAAGADGAEGDHGVGSDPALAESRTTTLASGLGQVHGDDGRKVAFGMQAEARGPVSLEPRRPASHDGSHCRVRNPVDEPAHLRPGDALQLGGHLTHRDRQRGQVDRGLVAPVLRGRSGRAQQSADGAGRRGQCYLSQRSDRADRSLACQRLANDSRQEPRRRCVRPARPDADCHQPYRAAGQKALARVVSQQLLADNLLGTVTGLRVRHGLVVHDGGQRMLER